MSQVRWIVKTVMERLPLFPLNTVLFPGMPIYLHIFEDRYKLMISRCIEERTPFGVVLLRSGSEVEGFGPMAEAYPIGCTAHITQVQPVGDGRMNIVAIGHERFRIITEHHEEPYLSGDVEYLPLHVSSSDVLRPRAERLRVSLERYLKTLEKIENMPLGTDQLPRDPLSLTYLAASILRLSPHEKQALLVEDDTFQLVQTLRTLYKREVMLLEIMATTVTAEPAAGTFSVN
jgi:Lon protease-like protein